MSYEMQKIRVNMNGVKGQVFLKIKGFDDAILGSAHGMTVQETMEGPVLIYDAAKCVDIVLENSEGVSRDEAWKHFDTYVMQKFEGPQTPIFLDPEQTSVIKTVLSDNWEEAHAD